MELGNALTKNKYNFWIKFLFDERTITYSGYKLFSKRKWLKDSERCKGGTKNNDIRL